MSSKQGANGQEQEAQDALFKEFQAYVRAIYEEATARTTEELEASCAKIISQLESGIARSMAEVQGKSAEFSGVLEDAKDGASKMLSPTLESFRQKLLADQLHFIDLLAGKLMAKEVELHRLTTESLDEHFRQGFEEMGERFDEVLEELEQASGSVEEGFGTVQKQLDVSVASILQQIAAAHRGVDSGLAAINALGVKSDQKVDAAANRLAQALQEGLTRLEKFLIGVAAGTGLCLLLVIYLLVRTL